ncbi:MAG: DUF4388 domain-containing protein [Candidatus Aminicenantes bacterium]|nr:DUF4388 domain-containing protein [Candidatus Aminicenantes bacterium]NIM78556.1 DUF4388 domain-containing protein [Candidatus Aminicenantes bacterium]NIN17802.1 DUF4388 domain-containing protein [Candidatus Aminicenantes bacterium]NIN41706.1 DUF4388 domain-containing protein [Candidatus Aminicenantes bacterium]NIN84455.1 DUF4388 domain-containing protein [Candidatus Aminicenantes bacterium]
MGSDSNSNFHREGEFNEGDMFSILYHIYNHDISGVLVVQSNDFEKKMVIRDRKIVFAASNRKLDSFGDYLLGNNLITKDIYRAAGQYMSENKKRFGRALIELGYFTYDQVWTWVPNHLQSIVFSFFKVKSGTYRIMEEHQEDIETENILLDMDILAVIVEGMRQFKSRIVVEKRFEAIEELYICNTNTHLLQRLDLKPYEIHVLTLVQQESKLEAILARSELLEFDTLRLLYLFLVLEIVSSQKNAGIKPSVPSTIPRLSTFNSFEEALKYYNMKYEVIYKVMLKEIGPISLSLLLKAIEDIKDNLPSYFQKIQLNPDGTINEELLLKALWYHDFDQHIGDLLRALEEVLYTEIYTVKKHLGVEYEQQVLKWIRGIGN